VTVRIIAALMVAFVVGLVMRAVFGHEHREENAAGGEGGAMKPTASADQSAASGPAASGDQTAESGQTAHPQEKARPPIIGRIELGLIVLVLVSLLAPNYLVQEGPYYMKVLVWGAATLLAAGYALWMVDLSRLVHWVRETWWFIKVIFPLLLGGVFLVGVIQAILPEQWVQDWLGSNTMLASFLATLIGAVSYFATMTEAPFVDALMDMGMGNGPALTLLLVGPGISLPNWLAIARIFGIKKAMVYVPVIIVLGTLVGWFFGNFIL